MITIGVLAYYIEDVAELQRNNKYIRFIPIRNEHDLHIQPFDYFIRLHKWERLPEYILKAVFVQEQLMGLTKQKDQYYEELREAVAEKPPINLFIDGRNLKSVFENMKNAK